MSRWRPSLLVLLSLATLGSLGLAWRQTRALDEARKQLVDAEAAIAKLRQRPSRLHEPAGEPASPRGSSDSAAPASASAGSPPPPPDRGPARFGARRAGFMAEMLADPEIAPLLHSQRKRAVETRYAALFNSLGLPVEQLERLKALLADKQISRAETQALARSQGLDRDDSREMGRQAEEEADAQIKNLLGEARFDQLRNYDATYAQRVTANTLAQRLGVSGAPLQAPQTEQLVQILAAHSPPATNDSGADRLGPGGAAWLGGRNGADSGPAIAALGRSATDADVQTYLTEKATRDAAVLEQAASVLTPAQLGSLRQMQQEETEQIRLLSLMRSRARRGAGDRPNRPPGD